MAGGVSTPELVAAVEGAGGLGFLAAGYLTPDALSTAIEDTRARGAYRFGVNLFVPGPDSGADLTSYAQTVAGEAARLAVSPGEPRWDDDHYPAKLRVVVGHRVPAVSFTFGVPSADDVADLHGAGASVLVTVTSAAEALLAVAVGADALCVQGIEAGGHRALFVDDASDPLGGPAFGLLDALATVRAVTSLPLIATGGLMTAADVAAVLDAGAVAAQVGTALLRCPEAGTTDAHRAALRSSTRDTAITRAFSGRPARGLRNRFLDAHTAAAPAAYPQVHHLTRPLRAAGDVETASLWAGTGYRAGTDEPAADVVGRLSRR